MSEPLPQVGRLRRLVEALPVLSALLVYLAGQGRVLLAAPALLAVLFAVARRVVVAHASGPFALSGAAGAVAGLAYGLVAPTYSPYVPPWLLSALCGGVGGLAVYCTFTRGTMYAGMYAWLLVVLSTYQNEFTPALKASLGLLTTSTLLAALVEARIHRVRSWHTLGGGLAFVALLLPVMVGLDQAALASVEPVLGLVMRLTEQAPRLGGAGLQDELRLMRTSSVPDDGRAILELAGDQPHRLRTTILQRFDGIVWLAPDHPQRLADPAPEAGPARTLELTLLQDLQPYLPAPGGVRRALETPAVRMSGNVLRAGNLRGQPVRLEYAADELNPPEDARAPELLFVPPDLRAELEPLAREAVGGATAPEAQARALERFFTDNFEYSLSTDLSGPGPALVRLVKYRRPAYCVYFASAMVAMLRTLGVPARVVGGFMPGEANRYTHRVTVRARDAHAWVEAYLPERGRFVAFDPTPYTSRDKLLAASRESELWEALTSAVRAWYLRLGGTPGSVLVSLARWPPFWLVVGALAAWSLWRRRGRKARGPAVEAALDAGDPALRRAYAAYLKTLRQHAELRPLPSETDDELLARLGQARGPEAAQAAQAFLARYRAARFGGARLPESEWAASLAALDGALRREARP